MKLKNIKLFMCCICALILMIAGGCSYPGILKSGDETISTEDGLEEIPEYEESTELVFNGLFEDNKKNEQTKKKDAISKESAVGLIETKFGEKGHKDENTGEEKSYVYENMQNINGEEYYNFRYSLINYTESGETDSISKVGNILVPLDGRDAYFAERLEDGWKIYDGTEIQSIYVMQADGNQSAVATLILNNDYSFSFSYDVESSYIPYGNFEIKDKKIICNTMDEKYSYVFDIIDKETISYNASESSVLELNNEDFLIPSNGSIFKLTAI